VTTNTETMTCSDGTTIVVELCPDCGGRPASAARLLLRADARRFCSCPFDEEHP
jgi:hypothetical protein